MADAYDVFRHLMPWMRWLDPLDMQALYAERLWASAPNATQLATAAAAAARSGGTVPRFFAAVAERQQDASVPLCGTL
jgi:hypothetical protein